jgi:hypothetical protein
MRKELLACGRHGRAGLDAGADSRWSDVQLPRGAKEAARAHDFQEREREVDVHETSSYLMQKSCIQLLINIVLLNHVNGASSFSQA